MSFSKWRKHGKTDTNWCFVFVLFAGVQFVWDCCCESVKKVEKSSGSGCILAHCMGLGKTLQVNVLFIYLFNIIIISLEPSCYNTLLWTAVNDICFLIMLWLHCKCDSAILSASCRWWRFSTLCCCARNWTSAQLWWCVHSTLCSTGSMSLRSGKKAWRTRRV